MYCEPGTWGGRYLVIFLTVPAIMSQRTTQKGRCSVDRFTDGYSPWTYAFYRGNQVLHPLRNRHRCAGCGGGERMEWCSRAAASAGERPRNARAALTVGTEFRS